MGKIRENIERAFLRADAREGLAKLIDAFVHFWLADAEVMRKLNALSTLDRESHAAERDAWRKQAIDTMMKRAKKERRLTSKAISRGTEALYMLTSFSSCELLAAQGRSERQIAARIRELVGESLGLDLTI